MLKRLFLLSFFLTIICCGIIEDTSEPTLTYTYIIKNLTGSELLIISDFGREQLTPNNSEFICETISSEGYLGGLCSGELEIRIPNTNTGYRCIGRPKLSENLCFVEDHLLFTISEGTIFTEIKTRTYEYVLTSDLLDNAFVLPE
ncbi:hypothetical protein AB1A65_01110 [Muricauda sp. ANG21]|uniref:hypothetical protein n=1 Tax=Allomuricauda sp. ANG21 TaxID=3042468 RepID=UPI003451DF5C